MIHDYDLVQFATRLIEGQRESYIAEPLTIAAALERGLQLSFDLHARNEAFQQSWSETNGFCDLSPFELAKTLIDAVYYADGSPFPELTTKEQEAIELSMFVFMMIEDALGGLAQAQQNGLGLKH